jgi:HNH endonuclease
VTARSLSAFDGDTKALIYQRARGLCDRCGMAIPGGMHFHHRNPRRMGGSDNIALGLPSNGVLLHPSCHDYIESHRKVAASLGFILGVEKDPMEWPVMLWYGWVYLNEDGSLTRLDRVPTVTERRIAPTERSGDVGGT